MNKPEVRPVRIGIDKHSLGSMTKAQAKRYGDKNMPNDLKKAGFKTFIGVSDAELHGGLWYRINYEMTVQHAR